MDNKYLNLINTDQENGLRVSMLDGLPKKPDEEAQLQRLSAASGVPVDALRYTRPEVELQQRMDSFDYKKAIAETPALAEFFSDPANASVAHDSWEGMGAAEKIWTKGKDYVGALGGGVVGDAIGGVVSGFGELYGTAARSMDRGLSAILPQAAQDVLHAKVVPWFLDPEQILKRGSQPMKQVGDWMKPPVARQGLDTDVVGGIGQLGGQIATYLLTGGIGAASTMYAQGADVMANKIAKDVADPALKDTAIVAGGAITAITEKYGLDKILNRVPPAIKNRTMRFLADTLAAGGIEAAQELTEGLLHDLARKTLTNSDAEVLGGVGREMTAAGISAAIVRAALGAKGYRHAQEQENVLRAALDTAADSKLRERMPEKYQSFLERVTQNGPLENIFIPAEQFKTYFQSQNMDDAAVAEKLGATNYVEAIAAGTDVVIPSASFVTQLASTDHANALLQDIRFNQGDMTSREAKLYEQNKGDGEIDLEALKLMTGADTSPASGFEDLKQQMLGELIGRFEPSTAAAYATSYAAAMSTIAQRAGVDPMELHRQFDLSVGSPLPAGLKTLADRVDVDLDPLLDRLRSGDIPAEQLAFGQSLFEFIRDAGGLQETGETKDLSAAVDRKPGQKKLVQKNGMSLDRALQSAIEAGYFPEGVQDLTESDLLDALGADLAGSRVYSAKNEDQTTAAMNRTLRSLADWLDTIGADVKTMSNAQIRAIVEKSAVDGVGDVYNQDGDNRNLIVAHNLSVANLMHAGEIGGLPAPSLAVTKADTPLEGFGEITLIGGIDLARPSAKNPIYDADVYSPRFPSVQVKVNEGAMRKALAPYEATAESAGFKLRGIDYAIDDMARGKLRDAISRLSYDTGMRIAYAKDVLGKEIAIPREAPKPVAKSGAPLIEQSPLKEALTGKTQADIKGLTPEKSQELARQIYAALINKMLIEDAASESPKGLDATMKLVNRRIGIWADNEIPSGSSDLHDDLVGPLTHKGEMALRNLMANAAAPASQEVQQDSGAVDVVALRRVLDDEVPRDQLDAWLHEKLAPALGERRIVKENGRTAAYTMDNIVKEMTRKVRDAEGFNYGLGNARSKGATKFKNIAQIQGRRDQIVGKGEFEAAKAEIEKEFNALIDAVTPYQTYKNDSATELLSEAIGNSYSKPIGQALEDAALSGVPADVQKRIGEFAAALVNAPTEYFEAKPQRAVTLDEFAGAVIPAGMPQEARAILEASGLKLVEYSGSQDARAEAVASLSRELDAETGGKTLFQRTGTERGSITIQPDMRMRINLFENADLSTLLHESGHFYLEVLGELAAQPGTNQELKDDYAKIREWMGLKDGEAIQVQHHEMFARANEAYLMEGKAPNPELQSVFAKFASWLKRIYQTVKSLNVPMNAEIRGVFDRIYATDEQIQAAQQEGIYAEAFATAEDAGMTEAEFKAYRKQAASAIESGKAKLRAKLMKAMLAEETAQRRAARKAMRETVEAEVNAEPVYVAMDVLAAGKTEDGEPIKLSKKLLVKQYGNEFVTKSIPKVGGKALYTEDGGSDLDTVAEVLGFDSGRLMLDQLVNAQPKKALIESITDERMREQYPDPLTDGTIAEKADEALHNATREDLLKLELRLIRKKAADFEAVRRAKEVEANKEQRAGEKMVKESLPRTERVGRTPGGGTFSYQVFDPEPMKRAAAGMMAQKRVRDVSPNSYLMAERRAALAFADAMKAKDFQLAASLKQKELFNHYLYKEAVSVREEMDNAANYLKKQGATKNLQRLGKAGSDYLEQVQDILERYELKDVSLARLNKRQSLLAWVNEQEAAGNAVSIPEEVLNEARRVNWREVPVEELRGVRDSVKNIEHLARMKNTLLTKKGKQDFQSAINELVTAVEESGFKSTGELSTLNRREMGLMEKGARLWRKMDANLLKMEQVVEWLDGGKIDGPWRRLFWDLADQAQTKEYDLHRQVTMALNDLRKSMPDAWNAGLDEKAGFEMTIRTANGSETVAPSRYTMLSIALNMGNAQNMQRLRDGNGISDAQMMNIRNSMTDADWQFVQGVWDAVELLWPDMAAMEKRVSGLAPTKVEAQSFDVNGKVYRGGYFPIVYDSMRSVLGEKQADADATVQAFLSAGAGRPTTNKGATKTRQDVVNSPLMLDFNQVLGGHVAKVVKDISHREAVQDMYKILSNDQLKQTLIDRLGMDRYTEMKNFVKALVIDRADILNAAAGIGSIAMKARTNLSIVTMGFKASTAFSQFAGYGPSRDFVKGRFLFNGALKAWKLGSEDRAENFAMMYEKSGEMRHRAETLDRDLRDALRRVSEKRSAVAEVQRTAFYFTALADKQVSGATWLGAYEQSLAEGMTDENAVAYADKAVRMSQGSGGAKDLAAVQRDNEFMRLVTMFYTPFSVLYSRLRDIGHQTAVQGIGYLPTAVARSLWLVAMPAVLGQLMAGRGPDDDEDKVWWSIRQMLMYPMATVPILRDFAGVSEQLLINVSGEGKMDFAPSYQLSPIASAMTKAWNNLVANPVKWAVGDKEFDDKMGWGIVESSGLIFGLPTAQVSITGSYLLDLINGDADPENALDILKDALFKRKKEK